MRRIAVSRALGFFLAAGAVAAASCSTGSESGEAQCIAAGGQCISPFEGSCAKLGPSNTCDCEPTCEPGGPLCCLELAVPDGGADAATE